ncbi:MAG TPA: hypothetical protein VF078_03965 [Nitrospira sp.]
MAKPGDVRAGTGFSTGRCEIDTAVIGSNRAMGWCACPSRDRRGGTTLVVAERDERNGK